MPNRISLIIHPHILGKKQLRHNGEQKRQAEIHALLSVVVLAMQIQAARCHQDQCNNH